jgi:GNAT superfamily N-acetyltransferase
LEIEIHSFDMRHATKDEWASFHRVRKDAMSFLFPGDPITDDATSELMMDSSLSENDIIAYAVIEKGNPENIIAWARITFALEDSPSYQGNEHICSLGGLVVLPSYQRRGIARQLFSEIHKQAQSRNKSLLVGVILSEGGRIFLRKLGGTEALEWRENRFDLNDVDWPMVEKWDREGRSRSPDATLEFVTSIPDDILEDYCRVYTEIFNQMPRDELQVGDTIYTPERWKDDEKRAKDSGATHLTAFFREDNGDISGLTDVFYIPSLVPQLSQAMTGVREEYRGQGKGKWLKAAMLLKIKNQYPDIETIITRNATSNKPMLAINERLGFKLTRELYNFQVELSKVKEYLESSHATS